MPARVICISRALAAGGEVVGHQVAERLGFRYLDEEIVALAAERAELDPEVVADVERRRSFVRRLFEGGGGAEDALTRASVDFGDDELTRAAVAKRPSRAADFRALIRQVIYEQAEEGSVVIVAHAASIALRGRPDLLRVLVTASVDTRARRVADEHDLDRKEAAEIVRESDTARLDYLKRFYGYGEETAADYDLVINTDVLTPTMAVELTLSAAAMIDPELSL